MERNIFLILRGGIALLALLVCFEAVSFADTTENTEASRVQKLESQVLNLQEVIAKQNEEIQKIKTSLPSLTGERVVTPLAAPAPISKEDFLSASKEVYPWAYGLKQGGDLRLRYETFDTSDCESTPTLSCNRSRNRSSFRLRYGFEKKLNDEFVVGFRLATGTTTDPSSEMQTMTGYFTYKPLLLDQAYAVYTPSYLKGIGPLDSVELGAGKVKNPFEKYSSKFLWDRDVTPEGLYEKLVVDLWTGQKSTIKWDVTGGQFILNEGLAKNSDAELFGVQTGFDVATTALGTERPIESKTGFSFYNYSNWDRTVIANTSGIELLKGNTENQKHMRVFDIYQELKFYPFNRPVTFWGDFATNPGEQGISAFIDPRDSHLFAIGTTLGEAKKKGQWDVFLNYAYMGANSVVGAFNDSDFGLGHTNLKGWNFGLDYALTDFLIVSWTNSLTEPVEPFDSTFASSDRTEQQIYRTQINLDWKF